MAEQSNIRSIRTVRVKNNELLEINRQIKSKSRPSPKEAPGSNSSPSLPNVSQSQIRDVSKTGEAKSSGRSKRPDMAIYVPPARAKHKDDDGDVGAPPGKPGPTKTEATVRRRTTSSRSITPDVGKQEEHPKEIRQKHERPRTTSARSVTPDAPVHEERPQKTTLCASAESSISFDTLEFVNSSIRSVTPDEVDVTKGFVVWNSDVGATKRSGQDPDYGVASSRQVAPSVPKERVKGRGRLPRHEHDAVSQIGLSRRSTSPSELVPPIESLMLASEDEIRVPDRPQPYIHSVSPVDGGSDVKSENSGDLDKKKYKPKVLDWFKEVEDSEKEAENCEKEAEGYEWDVQGAIKEEKKWEKSARDDGPRISSSRADPKGSGRTPKNKKSRKVEKRSGAAAKESARPSTSSARTVRGAAGESRKRQPGERRGSAGEAQAAGIIHVPRYEERAVKEKPDRHGRQLYDPENPDRPLCVVPPNPPKDFPARLNPPPSVQRAIMGLDGTAPVFPMPQQYRPMPPNFVPEVNFLQPRPGVFYNAVVSPSHLQPHIPMDMPRNSSGMLQAMYKFSATEKNVHEAMMLEQELNVLLSRPFNSTDYQRLSQCRLLRAIDTSVYVSGELVCTPIQMHQVSRLTDLER